MNLSEFLLARIAEDGADAMVGWRWKALPAGEYARLQARVLAECEAKRRLIALGEKDSYWDDVLGLLALPYADHPDYDETWRP